jgi:hypothetical protein
MRITPDRFKEKIARLREYKERGKRAEVIEAFALYKVTERTLDEWLADPNPNARYVKNGTFDKILRHLPDLKIAEHVRSYRLALSERGLDEATQQPIAKYNGMYEIVSNIDKSVIDLWSMRILFTEDISFPVFKLRAKFIDKNTGRSKTRICDGYIILDGQRLIFTGIGEYFVAVIWARAAVNPSEDPMLCTINIEDRNSGHVYTTSGAIKRDTSADPIDEGIFGDFFTRL